MAKNFRIELDDADLGQALDGLEMRVEAWEMTARIKYIGKEVRAARQRPPYRGRNAIFGQRRYRAIIAKIRVPMEGQR